MSGAAFGTVILLAVIAAVWIVFAAPSSP